MQNRNYHGLADHSPTAGTTETASDDRSFNATFVHMVSESANKTQAPNEV